jgi:hypothetical protein
MIDWRLLFLGILNTAQLIFWSSVCTYFVNRLRKENDKLKRDLEVESARLDVCMTGNAFCECKPGEDAWKKRWEELKDKVV